MVMNDIQLRDLTKRYKSTIAVDRLTFGVNPGTVTGFLGPNGAGKSTTMRMIIGLDGPDQGSALVNGKAYGDLKWPMCEVGTMLNPRDFQPGRTARAHLAALAAGNQIPANDLVRNRWVMVTR
jgi:ABC-2 type transport system ATP-binding protein